MARVNFWGWFILILMSNIEDNGQFFYFLSGYFTFGPVSIEVGTSANTCNHRISIILRGRGRDHVRSCLCPA